MVGWLGWGLVARYRRARWSRRRLQSRLARHCGRSRPLDELWRAWCWASDVERARFLAEAEELPYYGRGSHARGG